MALVSTCGIPHPSFAQYQFAAARYTASGSLDPSFGSTGEGWALTELGPSPFEDIRALAPYSGGKIVAAGCAWAPNFDHPEYAVIRYDSDGTPDPAFGTDGVALTRTGGACAMAVAVQPDGKIVTAGDGFAVVRYNADGTPDRGFGIDGIVTTAFPDTTWATARAVTLVRDKIVVVGAGDGAKKYVLARYDAADGSLDSTFGNGGTVVTEFPATETSCVFASAVLVQSDGKIVVAGSGGWGIFTLARYEANGTPDETFGSGGQVITHVGPSFAGVSALAVRKGKILAAGDGAHDRFGVSRLALACYDRAGNLETSVFLPFGREGGVTAVAFSHDVKSIAAAGVDYGDGSGHFRVARYTLGGTSLASVDTTFGTSGGALTDLSTAEEAAYAIMLDGKNRVVAGGGAADPE